MASTGRQFQPWSNVKGWNRTMSPTSLPEGLVPAAVNLELIPGSLGRRRPSAQTLDLTSGPGKNTTYLYDFVTAAGVHELWAFSSEATPAHRLVAGVWSGVSLPDNPAAFTAQGGPHAATLNGKLYLAYNSDVNRLHVWDGTAVRRVGVGVPAAPTAANGGGAGAYAAIARYYRVQMGILSGTTVVTESELSLAVSFTPGGANANATITKPTTIDSATHWRVFGLIGTAGDTYNSYEDISGWIVVGTTTFADTVAPASYVGDAPPQLGLNIPPPSAMYLLSDGNRLLMTGAWESTAAAGETVPFKSRIWVTRVLGSSDRGDDETIPNTTTQKNWTSIGESDGDQSTGLGGPIDGGVVYAFKKKAIWTLTPTGIDTVPYATDKLTGATGASAQESTNFLLAQYCILTAETHLGQPAVYFCDGAKVYRVSSHEGIQLINSDLAEPIDGTTAMVPVCSLYWVDRRQLMFGAAPDGNPEIHVYSPNLSWLAEDGVIRGGWSRYLLRFHGGGSEVLGAMALYPIVSASFLEPVIAGGLTSASARSIGYFTRSGNTGSDPGAAFTTSVTSRPYLLGGGTHNVTAYAPFLQAACTANATPSVAYIPDFNVDNLRSAVAPALTAVGNQTRAFVKVDGLEMADARALQVKVTWDSDQFGNAPNIELTDAVWVPYLVQEDVTI